MGVNGINLRERSIFSLLWILLFSALHVCPKLPFVKFSAFLFPSIKALLFKLRILPSEADGNKWVSPVPLASGQAGRLCPLPGRAAQSWALPLQEPPPASLDLVLWFCPCDPLPEGACLKFPDPNKEGAGRPWLRESGTQL